MTRPPAQVSRRRLLAAAPALAAALALPRAVRADVPVLRFSWWGGSARHQATLAAVRRFHERHPGVRIKAEYMGFNGYLERLTTQIAGRSEPDVMQINWAWIAMFSKRGTGLTDLDPYRELLPLDQYDPAEIAMGRRLGRLNALPVSYSARVLLWQRRAFAAAGLPLPGSWDELLAAGPAFRARLGGQHYPLDGELYDMVLLAQTWVQQQRGVAYLDPEAPRVSMDEAAALAWVRFYQRLVAEHVCTSLPLRASLGGAEKPTEQQPDWVRGRWAGNYTWDSVIGLRGSTLPPDAGLALGDFPTLDGAKNSGMFGRPTLMFAVGKHCRQPEWAARFISFLLADPEATQMLGRTRGIPSARKAYEGLRAAGKLPALELQAFEQVRAQREAGAITLPQPLFEHARMQKFIREVFETVAYGKSGAEDAARRLRRDGQALLQRIA